VITAGFRGFRGFFIFGSTVVSTTAETGTSLVTSTAGACTGATGAFVLVKRLFKKFHMVNILCYIYLSLGYPE